MGFANQAGLGRLQIDDSKIFILRTIENKQYKVTVDKDGKEILELYQPEERK